MQAPRALDHVVVPCADLAAAAEAYAALGFTVGRRNRHPWGTENHLIQCPGAFLELVGLAPDYVPLAAVDEAFPFAGFLAGQGGSAHPSGMLVLRSDDAAADACRMRDDGIASGRMLHFARQGQASDGATRTVAFTLAFAEAPVAPDLGFFVCQQHYPEHFWNAAMQRHRNGVTGIGEIVFTAPEPRRFVDFLSRFALQPDCLVDPDRVALTLAGGTRLTTRPGGSAPRLAGIRFAGHSETSHVAHIGALELVFGTEATA